MATPLVALTWSVPPSDCPVGLPIKATVSLPLKSVATFPWASSAVTVNANELPAITVEGGWDVMNNCVAAPGVTEIVLLVADVSVPLVTASVYPLPARFKLKPENVAMPLVAVALNDPPSVPPRTAGQRERLAAAKPGGDISLGIFGRDGERKRVARGNRRRWLRCKDQLRGRTRRDGNWTTCG